MEFAPPRSPFNVPGDCPRCGTRFDSAIPKAIEGMQKVYKALVPVPLKDTVTFTRDRDTPFVAPT